MDVITAKSAGFCFGVKRAVEKVYAELEKGLPIYTLGPIIHNEEVVGDLEKRGVVTVNTPAKLLGMKTGTVIIRSHGVAKEVYDFLKTTDHNIVDATCPFVLKIHRIVEKESKDKDIIIVGNDAHPEVEGIKGWSSSKTVVISSVEEAKAYLETKKDTKAVCVVAQTTFNTKKFKDIVEILSEKEYSISAISTICSATEERQQEARAISQDVDAMIVIGGKNSSNSRKLYEICKEECNDTYFIQTLDDLVLTFSKSVPCVGITAGASTPNKIIEEVQNYVRINF